MTKKEIDQLILDGKQLEVFFGSTKNVYSLGDIRITQKQYQGVIERFKDRLNFKMILAGFTRHQYTIKPIDNEQH